MGKRFAGLVAAAWALALLAACGAAHTAAGPGPSTTAPRVASGAPHLVVCGETLSTSAAGPVVYDIASHVYPPVTAVTVGGVIYVRVSNSCTTGAVVKLTPPDAFETVRTIRATDGRIVLVELRPNAHPVAVLSATSGGASNEGQGIVFLRLHIAPVGVLHCPTGPCANGPASDPGPVPATAPGAVGTVVGVRHRCCHC